MQYRFESNNRKGDLCPYCSREGVKMGDPPEIGGTRGAIEIQVSCLHHDCSATWLEVYSFVTVKPLEHATTSDLLEMK